MNATPLSEAGSEVGSEAASGAASGGDTAGAMIRLEGVGKRYADGTVAVQALEISTNTPVA